MKGKQKIFAPKSLVIGSLVATATAFGAATVSPLSAKAQNSPVITTPVSPVTITDVTDIIFNLSGSDTSTTDSSTTTTTTTTADGTTTTTTITTSTETTSTAETSSTQETTDTSTTSVLPDFNAIDSTTVLETTNVSTGVEAQSGLSTTTETSSTNQTVAVVISLSEQYALDTGVEFAFISDIASQLGVGGELLVGTLVFDRVRGVSGNKQTALQAFVNALQRAGALNIDSFDNAAFADFFSSYSSAEELAGVFNGLSEIRIQFLSRGAKFFAAKGSRFRLFQTQQITLAQFFAYKYTGSRSLNFPRERN
jgi:hypothetical protein